MGGCSRWIGPAEGPTWWKATIPPFLDAENPKCILKMIHFNTWMIFIVQVPEDAWKTGWIQWSNLNLLKSNSSLSRWHKFLDFRFSSVLGEELVTLCLMSLCVGLGWAQVYCFQCQPWLPPALCVTHFSSNTLGNLLLNVATNKIYQHLACHRAFTKAKNHKHVHTLINIHKKYGTMSARFLLRHWCQIL